MRGRLILAAALLCQACAPAALPVGTAAAVEKRPPLPGHAGYPETVKFISDGLQYLQPNGAFLVSPAGDLCFRGAMEITAQRLANYRDFWCMSVAAVASVDALKDDVTNVPELRLWCRHAAPYCAWRVGGIGYPLPSYGWSDTITVQAIPSQPEKAALEYLIYLLGGDLRAGPLTALDSGPAGPSVASPKGKWEDPR